MQRTAGAKSDAGGRARTQFWDATEIGFAALTIGAGATVSSEIIHGEGYRDFHVYTQRSVGTASAVISVNVFRPWAVPGAPLLSGGPVVIGTWAVLAGQVSGVFYFGEKALLTDAQGRTFRFSPIFSIQIQNTSGAPAVFDVFVHMQD